MIHSADFFKDDIRNGFYVPTAVKMAWASCLDVLSEIDRICTKYDIAYFADWGTFLGAVRHGGFVPWDDDLDICMKRDDYVRFREVADSELPSHYDIHDYARHEDHWMFLARVVNNKRMNFDVSYMTEHYNFPYLAGVDIFVKDYLYDDEEREHKRDKEIMNILAVAEGIISSSMSDDALKKCLGDLKIKYRLSVPADFRSRETAVELYRLAESIMSEVGPEETTRIGQIYPFLLMGSDNRVEEKKAYDDIIRVPFEDTSIPVPADYSKMLASRYGNYFTVRKVWSGHVYPFYETQKAEMERLMGSPFPSFTFDASMLKKSSKEDDGSLRVLASECMAEFETKISIMTEAITAGDVALLLENAQEFTQLASDLITFIKQVKGDKNTGTELCVTAILKMCNDIGDAIQLCAKGEKADTEVIAESFSDAFDKIEKHIIKRREVLFVATGASRFTGFSESYNKECGRDDTDIYVVPVPYLVKDPLGQIITNEEEAAVSADLEAYGEFVKAEHLCEYYLYEPSLHCPDVIYIQDPYDGENPLLTLPPVYYSENLRKYTDSLVFIPFGRTSDFGPDDVTDVCNMKHYVTAPGMVYSDEIRIWSENIKEMYVKCLSDFAGKETEDIWIERIKVEKMPENSEERNGKKKILYCIGANEMFEYGEKVADALLDRFKTFVDASEGIDVGVTVFPEDRKEWSNANSKTASKVFKAIDDAVTKDNIELITSDGRSYEEIASGYDAYYGSPSPYVLMFTQAGKPAMLSNYSVNGNE